MKKEYNLKKLKRINKPAWVGKELKIVKTIRLDMDIVSWLLQESKRRGIPYQTLINSILKETMRTEGHSIVKDVLREEIREIVKEEIRKAS